MAPQYSTYPGTLYKIPRAGASPLDDAKPLVAFEHVPTKARGSTSAENTVIFLGGLFDGLLTVPYVAPLAESLPESWSVIEPVLGSNYRQWGVSSLNDDVVEIEFIVNFFQQLRPGGLVVLLGHSTGCQMIMHYLLSDTLHDKERPKIDGGIMQAPASDREAIDLLVPPETIDENCRVAQEYVKSGRGDHVLPDDLTSDIFEKTPISANRWLSIASPGPDHSGEDDYFSSDFPDQRLETTFGRLGRTKTRVCFLVGEEDQFVPAEIDKQALVKSWHDVARKGGAMVDESSGVLEGASHTVKEEGEVLDRLKDRVAGFLHRLGGKK